jgi:hypothetical protein
MAALRLEIDHRAGTHVIEIYSVHRFDGCRHSEPPSWRFVSAQEGSNRAATAASYGFDGLLRSGPEAAAGRKFFRGKQKLLTAFRYTRGLKQA